MYRSQRPVYGVNSSTTFLDRVVMPLSERELAILRYLIRGSTNRQIAQELGITEASLKTHMTRRFQKLGVENRLQARTWAGNHPIDNSYIDGGGLKRCDSLSDFGDFDVQADNSRSRFNLPPIMFLRFSPGAIEIYAFWQNQQRTI